MKTGTILAILLNILAVAGCKERKVVDINMLDYSNGLVYEANSETLFTGKSVEYWPNGQTSVEIEYLNGTVHGKWIIWHENGQKEDESKIREDELISQKCWNENGDPTPCDQLPL